ncbi:GntR family transcriptional regulator [Shinella sp. CPCC 100929]|uniref:GntR family transcriptional regulator n=1 Tax=Shinella lacus TaxID=2654216 RepID=A0ABT1RIC5_9HYPH|nr:GntR family transcriptional regulator [Shinella lacus]MCQ4634930.1 GntR family transcriptional regulator [Shinella lacus]
MNETKPIETDPGPEDGGSTGDGKLPLLEKLRGRTEGEIRRRILQAIFEQRLPAGESITEEQLAATFDVSRTVIRQAVARLAQDGILVKSPNKGTAVASPSRKEARDILFVRRLVEPEIVRLLASAPHRFGLTELRKHLAEENEARLAGQRGTLVRLTGEFHLLLAELSGNQVLLRLMTQLQTLTCLAVLLYAEHDEACPRDEHLRIVDAIAAGDGGTAAQEMLNHLTHVEKDLKLDRMTPESSFGDAMGWLRGVPDN